MASFVQLLKYLPPPVLRRLDAWSAQVAQRRAQRRHLAWLSRQASSSSRL
jgi:hypothetical protein